MNQVLALLNASRGLPEPQRALHSDHMLAELLSLHGDMIEQLRLEQHGQPDKPEFITLLIEQHEKTADLLRAKIESRAPEADGPALANPPLDPARHHHRALYFAASSLLAPQGASGPAKHARHHVSVQA